MDAPATLLSKPISVLETLVRKHKGGDEDSSSEDESNSANDDEGEAKGKAEVEVKDEDYEKAVQESQYESETEEPPVIENETEEEAEKRIKNQREGNMIFVCAGRTNTANVRKQVLRAAKLGYLPAQVIQ